MDVSVRALFFLALLAQTSSQACDTVSISSLADISAFQQCTTVTSFWLNISETPEAPISFPSLLFVGQNFIVSIAGGATASLSFPALSQINGTLAIGGPSCSGALQLAFGAASITVRTAVNILIPASCQLTAFSMPTLRRLGSEVTQGCAFSALVWGTLQETTLGSSAATLAINGSVCTTSFFGSVCGSIQFLGVSALSGITALLSAQSGVFTFNMSGQPFLPALTLREHVIQDGYAGGDLFWRNTLNSSFDLVVPIETAQLGSSIVAISSISSIGVFDFLPDNVILAIDSTLVSSATAFSNCNNSGILNTTSQICTCWTASGLCSGILSSTTTTTTTTTSTTTITTTTTPRPTTAAGTTTRTVTRATTRITTTRSNDDHNHDNDDEEEEKCKWRKNSTSASPSNNSASATAWTTTAPLISTTAALSTTAEVSTTQTSPPTTGKATSSASSLTTLLTSTASTSIPSLALGMLATASATTAAASSATEAANAIPFVDSPFLNSSNTVVTLTLKGDYAASFFSNSDLALFRGDTIRALVEVGVPGDSICGVSLSPGSTSGIVVNVCLTTDAAATVLESVAPNIVVVYKGKEYTSDTAPRDKESSSSSSTIPVLVASFGGSIVILGLIIFMLRRNGRTAPPPPSHSTADEAQYDFSKNTAASDQLGLDIAQALMENPFFDLSTYIHIAPTNFSSMGSPASAFNSGSEGLDFDVFGGLSDAAFDPSAVAGASPPDPRARTSVSELHSSPLAALDSSPPQYMPAPPSFFALTETAFGAMPGASPALSVSFFLAGVPNASSAYFSPAPSSSYPSPHPVPPDAPAAASLQPFHPDPSHADAALANASPYFDAHPAASPVAHAVADANVDVRSLPPLVWAVSMQDIPQIRALAAAGAEMNPVNSKWQTPLHLACMTRLGLPVIAALLECGTHPGVVDCEASTPLMYACRTGDSDALAALLRTACQPGRTDSRGMTALMHACTQAFPVIVKMLLEHDPDMVNARDKCGWTALHWAAAVRSTECVMHLLECKKISVSITSRDDETPLHIIARNGDTELARALLERLPPSRAQHILSLPSARGLTPSQAAGAVGFLECARLLDTLSVAFGDQFRPQPPPPPMGPRFDSQATSEAKKKRPGASRMFSLRGGSYALASSVAPAPAAAAAADYGSPPACAAALPAPATAAAAAAAAAAAPATAAAAAAATPRRVSKSVRVSGLSADPDPPDSPDSPDVPKRRRAEKVSVKDLEAKVSEMQREHTQLEAEIQALRAQALQLRAILPGTASWS